MMIPMVLGSMLAVYSYKSSGSSTGIMMYTGIITACSSALIGVVWALINMRYTNKSVLENEKKTHRKLFRIHRKTEEQNPCIKRRITAEHDTDVSGYKAMSTV